MIRLTLATLAACLFLLTSPGTAFADHCILDPSLGVSEETYEGLSDDDHYCERHGFLGPVGWWWNTIYYRLFDGSGWWMLLAGWELFIGGLLFAAGAAIKIADVFRTGLENS